ncbi:hypothetical protein SNEBB_005261 [Seison nebaliae]|nr:hypothetical protein SNEBB_005261 [Seison nebaliae]
MSEAVEIVESTTISQSSEMENVDTATNGETTMKKIDEEEKVVDIQKLKRQFEYYFSNANLVHDTYMKKLREANDEWIDIEEFHKFRRINLVTNDTEILKKAIEICRSDLIDCKLDDEDGKFYVKRINPESVPATVDELRQQCANRTCFVKGFPLNAQLDHIQRFFDTYGQVENLTMIRKQLKFKGSVYVVFEKEEDYKKFMAIEEPLTFENKTELEKFSMEERQKKIQEKVERLKESKEKREENKKKIEEEKEVLLEEQLKEVFVPYSVIHMENIDKEESRESLKEMFDDIASVSWIDFARGDFKGHIRFRCENDAIKIMKKKKEDLQSTKIETTVEKNEEEVKEDLQSTKIETTVEKNEDEVKEDEVSKSEKKSVVTTTTEDVNDEEKEEKTEEVEVIKETLKISTKFSKEMIIRMLYGEEEKAFWRKTLIDMKNQRQQKHSFKNKNRKRHSGQRNHSSYSKTSRRENA